LGICTFKTFLRKEYLKKKKPLERNREEGSEKKRKPGSCARKEVL